MGKKAILLGLLFLFFISCGSSSSGTSAGDLDPTEPDVISDFLWHEETGSSRVALHQKTGFYEASNHIYGFEDNLSSEHDGEAHVSYDEWDDGMVEWYVKWGENEIDETYRYFICDPSEEDLDKENANLKSLGRDEECLISTEDLEKGEKSCGVIDVKKYYNMVDKKIGICQSCPGGAPVLKAILHLHPYEKKVNQVYYTKIDGGDVDPADWDNLEKAANKVFKKAVTVIDIKGTKYSRNAAEGYSDIKVRDSYIFIAAAHEAKYPDEDCYISHPDDIDLLKDYVDDNLFSDYIRKEGRILARIDKHAAVYWTFTRNGQPCVSNDMYLYPDRSGIYTYKVGVLNSKRGELCSKDYTNMQMQFRDGTWKIQDLDGSWNMGEWTDDLSVIDPECHVLYTTDLHGKTNAYLMQRHISETSKAVTKPLDHGQLALFYKNTNDAVTIHEIAHLLNLSDVQKEGNLMNYTGGGLNLQYSMLKARKDDNGSFDKNEYQWDCFHDITRCAYPYEE
jgi:hypothetical protein